MQAEIKRDSFSTGFKHRLSLFNYPLAGTSVSVIIIVTQYFQTKSDAYLPDHCHYQGYTQT